MKLFARTNKETTQSRIRSVHNMLLTQGLGGTLEYLCTFSVFSVLSEA